MQHSKPKSYAYAYSSKTSNYKKGTLSRYTSYSNLIKSQDNLLEKQKLKEENWKLKNLSNSLNEENKKLKDKLNKRFSVLDHCNLKQFHVVNHNSNIEKIKEDIAKIRDELQPLIAENLELTSKLSKQVDKKTEIDQASPQPLNLLKVSSGSRKHAEESNEKKIINELNLEISELTVSLQSLTAKNILCKDQIASYKDLVENRKKNSFQLTKETCVNVFPQAHSLKNAKKLRPRESSSDSSEI